ncbi:aldose 1-epimerase family protein [Francisella frigiditurris]|uniref:Aldose 1-epimerase family protein n=1 Tax=Francisella frigiditurris TaxID=1542390 RepID=A0A1J0KSY0_9GAMM|nr:aldose 1-epimerase family protein [Francisella frigiditurris]APC96803.1 aldose 1-epimerase family protein [Francisella frigiditurris]
MVTIESDTLQVEINLLGAEVQSVRNIASNHEYMWSGDGLIWAGVSPVLFPVVGKSHNNKIKYQGKEYPMGNHGLARHTIFDIVFHSENSVVLAMETTADNYPFKLRFEVTYTLDANKLITEYNIINLDEGVAFCGFGAHPAFACPFDDKHQFSDYEITFTEQKLDFHPITPEAFYTGETKHFKISKVQLSNHTFDNDALVYSGFSDKKVRLAEKGSDRYIEVTFDGFEYLGLWSKPKANAPYVCIEPWCGRSDTLGMGVDIEYRIGNIDIQPQEKFSRSYSIEFGY